MTITELLISRNGSPKVQISNDAWIYWDKTDECWNVCFRRNGQMQMYRSYEEEQAVAMLLSLEGLENPDDHNFE